MDACLLTSKTIRDERPTDALALRLCLLRLPGVVFCNGLYTFQDWVRPFPLHTGEPPLEVTKHVLSR